ncbi:hypothetical protein ACLS0R_14995 [Comamonas jiangduensis]|uniref:hypothetical protein n=1 Tax=Comamonas jiangduensis TaxID=1194168 RepID=UPI003BF8E672
MSSDNFESVTVSKVQLKDLYFRAAFCKLNYVATILFFSLSWMFFSWLQDQADGTWFARSGALPTVATALASIWLAKYRELLLGGGGFRSLLADDAEKKLRPYYNFIQSATFLVLAVSTLVWGYGDLVFQRFTNDSNQSTLSEGALVCLPWL